jgi:hypothetical protein
MAVLSDNQVKELVKKPRNRKRIHEAIRTQERIKLHAEATEQAPTWSDAYNNWLQWVNNLLKLNKKKQSFKEAISSPLATVSFVSDINDNYKKVFQSTDLNIDIQASTASQKQEIEEMMDGFLMRWKGEGFKFFETEASGFNIVEKDDQGQAYCYFLPIERVYDVEITKSDDPKNPYKVEYIIFCEYSNDEITGYVVIDQEKRFRVKKKETKKSIEVSIDRKNMVFHSEIPVRQFYTSKINRDNYLTAQVPIVQELGNLDKLLFKIYSKDSNDLNVEHPITWVYEEKQDNESFANQQPENAFAIGSDGSSSTGVGPFSDTFNNKNTSVYYQYNQPVKQEEKFKGAGTMLKKPYPTENVQDVGDPAGFVFLEPKVLQQISDNITSLEDKIYFNTTGRQREADNNSAKNEKQIISSYEGMLDKLIEVKTNFELIMSWEATMMARMQFDNPNIKVNVDLGRGFLFKSVEALEQDYKMAKENGMPESYLKSIQEQIIETKFQNNPGKRREAKILLNLEPFPTMSIAEAADVITKAPSLLPDFELKAKFKNLIDRFEAENGPISTFGTEARFDQVVETIREQLNKYINNVRSENGEISEVREETE